MSSSKAKGARIITLAMLMFFSPLVFGLGLGNVKVESFLNQPLNARIDLLVRPGEDISGVTASLASAEDYALIGASRDAISVPLRFTVDSQSEQPFVRVTSDLPVSQPVVRLIVELNWASGRLLREYTLFLDPPVVAAAAPPPVIDERRQPPAPATAPPVEAPVQSSISDTSEAVTEAEQDATPEAGTGSGPTDVAGEEPGSSSSVQFSGDDEYGPVKSGDTLWKIASNWSDGSAASINQVMLAIQRNNPQAFINNNINLLKRGAILRMPSSADIAAISPTEATAEVREQAALFAAGSASQPRVQAVAPAVETPLVDVASEMSSASQPVPDVDDGPKLEIVPPSEGSSADSAYGDEDSPEGSSASTSMVSLEEELALKEEALITEQQTNEYLQQRIDELESKVANSDGADLVVEDEQLAGMEARLRDDREAAAAEQANQTKTEQVTQVTEDPALPWYRRWMGWLIGSLVVLVAGIGWVFSRRNNTEFDLGVAAAGGQTVRNIKDEAEEILKVLEPVSESGAEQDNKGKDSAQPATGTEKQPEAEQVAAQKFSQAKHLDHEEALVLDEDSADPEVRLDLARAYISMGDREAARAILGEVIEHGDEAQKSEAQTMLDAI
ncbi:MAG TPA: FimV/HubP family polar landmark protein [Xanthomonadales bacterium]|nr:FimV/HubP family polar landmark protein [Xanthomonadales bacterium]